VLEADGGSIESIRATQFLSFSSDRARRTGEIIVGQMKLAVNPFCVMFDLQLSARIGRSESLETVSR